MKNSSKTLLAIGCAYAMTASSLLAQLVYTFDEWGDSIGPSSGPPISPGILQPDPSGGLPVPVLVYNLAGPVIPGDVLMTEPGSPAGSELYSDIVRFWNPTGGGASQIIFYSDKDDPILAPADTGLPTIYQPNFVIIPEVGPEGNNGAVYTPTPNQPGFILNGTAQVTYNITSDGVVPEPGTMALAGLGGGLMLLAFKRRRQNTV